MQHQAILEYLCEANQLAEEDKRYLIRLPIRAGALSFYDDLARSSLLSHGDLIRALNAR